MPASEKRCGWSFGRHLAFKTVAIGALATFLLFATNAQANIVVYGVIQSQSYLKYTTKLVGPALGGSKTGLPQYVGSDVTYFYGTMSVDVQDTTIQLLPGAYISAAVGAPGDGGIPGRYAPFDPVISDPSSATPGFTDNGNWGVAVAAIGLKSVLYNLRIDNGYSAVPSTPMPLAGSHFNLAGQALSFSDGRQAFISALGNDTDDVDGNLLALFGTAGSDIGTIDLIPGESTLTLPVHSSFSFVVTNDFGGISQFVDVEGQLVLVPLPEPATMTLLCIGVVALLARSWHVRKRRK